MSAVEPDTLLHPREALFADGVMFEPFAPDCFRVLRSTAEDFTIRCNGREVTLPAAALSCFEEIRPEDTAAKAEGK